MRIPVQAFGLMFLMLLAPLSVVLEKNNVESLSASSLSIAESESLEAGMWQTITMEASSDLAVFIPYFI